MSKNFMRIQKGLSFIGNLAADPADPREGDIYFNETYGALKTYRNGRWIAVEEAELIRLARIEEHPSDGNRVVITPGEQALPLGQTITLELSGLRLDFSGAEIDFSTGEVFEDDGLTPLGQDFIPSLPTGTNWRWFSVSLIPSSVNLDQTITAQILVIPANNEGATKDAAEKTVVSSTGKPLGFVAIQGDGGGGINAITWADIDQIAPSGTSGGDGSGAGIFPAENYYLAVEDTFDVSPTDSDSKVDSTRTNATHSLIDGLYKLECDKGLLFTTAGTTFSINNPPSFTISAGDIIWSDVEQTFRRIASLSDQQNGLLDAAFPTNLAGTSGMISQAVWTVDLTAVGDIAESNRPKDFCPNTDVLTAVIDYQDSLADGDTIADLNDPALICVAGSSNASAVYGPEVSLFGATGESSNRTELDMTSLTSFVGNTFTPASNSQPTKINVDMANAFAATGIIRVDIVAMNGPLDPNEAVILASSDPVDVSTIPAAYPNVQTFNFSTPPELVGGTQYFWFMRVVTTGAGVMGYAVGGGDSFPGEDPLVSTDGTTWVAAPSHPVQDIGFEVLGGVEISAAGFPNSDRFGGKFCRPTGKGDISDYTFPNPKEALYLCFFPDPDNASVTAQANLLYYLTSFYEKPGVLNGGVLDSAFCMSDSSGTPNNCLNPVVVFDPIEGMNVTEVTLGFDFAQGANAGRADTDLEVFIEGLLIPRKFSGVVGTYWYEVTGATNKVRFNADLSALSKSLHFRRSVGVVDRSDENGLKLVGIYSAIVGSASQVTSGAATHSSIQGALDAGAKRVLLLSGTFSENVTVGSGVVVNGHSDSVISGTLDVTGDKNVMRDFKVTGNVTISGDKNRIEGWQTAASTVSDTGTDNLYSLIDD